MKPYNVACRLSLDLSTLNAFILEFNVVAGTPSKRAAPLSPETLPPQNSNARIMFARSNSPISPTVRTAGWTLEWDQVLAANGILVLDQVLALDPVAVPEPSEWSFFAIGLFTAWLCHRLFGRA